MTKTLFHSHVFLYIAARGRFGNQGIYIESKKASGGMSGVNQNIVLGLVKIL